MSEKLKIWFDPESDFLEVRFSDKPGFERETLHDSVMERVDEKGLVIGFSVLGVSRFNKEKQLETNIQIA